MMHGHGKSDSPIVPTKPTNKAVPEAKETVQERGLAKGKTFRRNVSRTQSRKHMSSTPERIRQVSNRGGSERY